jgi:apolipoprotein N-acyltransferase
MRHENLNFVDRTMSKEHSNPYAVAFAVIATVLLNGIHFFGQAQSTSLIVLVPFVCYVPFLIVLTSKSTLRIAELYLISSVTFAFVGLLVSVRYHLAASYGLLGGLCGGLLFPTFIFPLWSTSKHPALRTVSVVCTWTALEYLVSLVYGTAVTLPIQLYRFPFLLRPISLFGSTFADAMLILSNWFIASSITQRDKKRRLFLIAWLFLIFMWLALSAMISWSISRETDGSVDVRVSTISPGSRFKGNLSDIINMTREAHFDQHADFIVWPEVYVRPEEVGQSCEDYVKLSIAPLLVEVNAYVVVGCEEFIDPIQSTCTTGNLAITVDRNGSGVMGSYGKQHPVTMIGEQSCVRNGYRNYGIANSSLSFSTLICYDADFEDSSAIVADMGASLILTPSEDWSAARSHFAASVFRAIENRVVIAKSDWGWDSAIIDSNGHIVSMFSSKKSHREILTGRVTLYPQSSSWNKYKFHVFPIACICVLGWMLSKALRKVRPHGLGARLL